MAFQLNLVMWLWDQFRSWRCITLLFGSWFLVGISSKIYIIFLSPLLGLAVLSFFALLRKSLKHFTYITGLKWVKPSWSSKSNNPRKVGLRVLLILSWEFSWWKPGRRTKMHLNISTTHILSGGFRPRRTWTTEELRFDF